MRRCTVEHVFGTLKFWMGSAHFLMKTMKHVGAEMSLHVLAYNLRRVMNIPGIAARKGAITKGHCAEWNSPSVVAQA